MLKRLLLTALLLVTTQADAQFVDGHVLTASQLNSAFANTLPITGGTLTGPLVAPNVTITGGTISGLYSPIPLASGGTGATTATGATSSLQYLQGATGSAARSVTSKLQDIITPLDFGARGDGTTNDTAAVQAAINAAAGKTLLIDRVYAVSGLAVQNSLRIAGTGTIFEIANSNAHLIRMSGSGVVLAISGITLDANQANQSTLGTYYTIYQQATSSSTVQTQLVLDGVTLQNGNQADISVYNSDSRPNAGEVIIRGSTFLGGHEGTTALDNPRYVDIRSPVNFTIVGNVFDRVTVPTQFGRAGIVSYDGWHTTGQAAWGAISGNTFNYVGRSNVSSTLGVIDLYSNGHSTAITGNSLNNSFGRGIQTKADAGNIAISGNVVNGLAGLSDGTMDGQITVNSNPYTTTVGDTYVISNNSLLNSGRDAIFVTGTNNNNSAHVTTVEISGNTIKNATNRSIGISGVQDVSVSGNAVYGSPYPFYGDQIDYSAVLTGNTFRSGSGSATSIVFTSACAGAAINITGNAFYSAPVNHVNIASGAQVNIQGNTFVSAAAYDIVVANVTGSLFVNGNTADATNGFYSDGGGNTGIVAIGEDNVLLSAPAGYFTQRTLTLDNNTSGTVKVSFPYQYLDTNASASSGNLWTINGAYDGRQVTFSPASAARVVTLVTGSGNMQLNGNFTPASARSTITLKYVGGTGAGFWREVARSNNP